MMRHSKICDFEIWKIVFLSAEKKKMNHAPQLYPVTLIIPLNLWYIVLNHGLSVFLFLSTYWSYNSGAAINARFPYFVLLASLGAQHLNFKRDCPFDCEYFFCRYSWRICHSKKILWPSFFNLIKTKLFG